MDGIHDMGGMHGFGKVEPESNEPVFHASWEGRCLALNRAMGAIGAWTIDEGRAGIEQLPPEVYLAASYYGKWAMRLHNMVVARGLAGADELAAGHKLHESEPPARRLAVADVPRTLNRGSFERSAATPARFAVGDRVRAKNMHPPTHTRLPRYIRGKHGVVQHNHGGFAFADTRAHGLGDQPHHVYSVRFEARELWGDDDAARDAVYIDLWEPYIEPAA